MSSKKIKPTKKATPAKNKPAKKSVSGKKEVVAANKTKDEKAKKVTAKDKNAKKVAPAKTKTPAVNKVKDKKTEKAKIEKKAVKPTQSDKIKKGKEIEKVSKGIEAAKLKSSKGAPKSKRGRKKKGSGDDDDEPMIDMVDDALLNEILETAKPKKKNTKEVKKIRTFVNPITSLTVAKDIKDIKKGKSALKEPKGKFELEFVIGTSPGILFEFLSTPSGLSEWFADDVNVRDGVFTFFWDGTDQKAYLLDFKEEKFIRFQWVDKPLGTYFEFKIEIDELTSDVSLMVTDFADEGSDLDTSKRLWESQIHTLMHVLGSY